MEAQKANWRVDFHLSRLRQGNELRVTATYFGDGLSPQVFRFTALPQRKRKREDTDIAGSSQKKACISPQSGCASGEIISHLPLEIKLEITQVSSTPSHLLVDFFTKAFSVFIGCGFCSNVSGLPSVESLG